MTTPRQDNPERGSMLIVALGILALLSILAVTFVKLMNLEQRATTNYVDMVRARLVAEGGLERTMAQLKLTITAQPYSDIGTDTWIYADGNYSLPLEQATHIRKGDPTDKPALNQIRASFSGSLGASYAGGTDRYKVKVLDTQTQFNLNSLLDAIDVPNEGKVDFGYIRFLDALGVAISQTPRTGTSGNGVNPIARARYPKGSANAYKGGMAFWMFRRSRENEEFKSKTELMEILESEEHYLLLKDYVTTRSWFDPRTVWPNGTFKMNTKPWGDVAARPKELRSPINLNLAPVEILAANLAGIGGRGIYIWTKVPDYQGVDESSNFAFTHSSIKEAKNYETKPVIVYIDPFGIRPESNPDPTDGPKPNIHGALTMAKAIKDHIKNNGPFRSFADWESFVDKTLTGPFIDNTRDPDNNHAFPFFRDAARRMTPLDNNNAGVSNASSIVNEPRFRHWYHEAVRSMLKANFNPNPRFSGFNPDNVVHLTVEKGNLLWRDPSQTNTSDPDARLSSRQTLEWCLAPKGIFEITSLGEVLGPPPEDAKRAQDLDNDGNPDLEIHAQAKVRGILQLYDTELLTTQRDFEFKGNIYKYGSTRRQELVSNPIPRQYWDPRPMQGEDMRVFYEDWASAGLMPSNLSGSMMLATNRKQGDIYHTQIVQQGIGAPDSPPQFEALWQDRKSVDGQHNGNDHADSLMADTSNGRLNNPNPGVPFTGYANRYGWPYGSARRGINDGVNRTSDTQYDWRFNVLTNDGYLSSMLRPSVLWYRASDNFKLPSGSQVPWPPAQGSRAELDETRRGESNITISDPSAALQNPPPPADPDRSGNVAPTPLGAVEFWYKPEYDWAHRMWTVPGSSPQGSWVPISNPPPMNGLYCGLLGISHVLKNDLAFNQGAAANPGGGSPDAYSRGTQLYMTRTTQGDVRITRLYFEVVGQAYDPANGRGGVEIPWVTNPATGGQKFSIAQFIEKCKTDQQFTWPPEALWKNLPSQFATDVRWARSDYWLPADLFKNWRAHEWHHFAFRWDDASDAGGSVAPSNRPSLEVWIDGLPFVPTPHQIGTPQGTPGYPKYQPIVGYDPQTNLPQYSQGNPGEPPRLLPAFVRLNMKGCRIGGDGLHKDDRPKDQITIGAVERWQVDKDDGVFKHDDDGQVVLYANGTVDDVRFYDGTRTLGTPLDSQNIAYDGRYVTFGNWDGEFDLSSKFPKDSQQLTLGGITFTAYLPKAYGPVQANQPVFRQKGEGWVRVRFNVLDSAGNPKYPAGVTNTWQATFTSNDSVIDANGKAGFSLRDGGGLPIRVDKTDRLVYTVEMTPAFYDRQSGFNSANSDPQYNSNSPPPPGTGAAVATPVLDDIQLIYFLPSSKVLLKERVNN